MLVLLIEVDTPVYVAIVYYIGVVDDDDDDDEL